jgi:hypothetical protein
MQGAPGIAPLRFPGSIALTIKINNQLFRRRQEMKRIILLFVLVMLLTPVLLTARPPYFSRFRILNGTKSTSTVVVKAQVHSTTPPLLGDFHISGDPNTGNWGLLSYTADPLPADFFNITVTFGTDESLDPGEHVQFGVSVTGTDFYQVKEVRALYDEQVPLQDMFSMTGYEFRPTNPDELDVYAETDTIVERLEVCVFSGLVPLEDMFSTGLGNAGTGPSPKYPTAVWNEVMTAQPIQADTFETASLGITLQPGEFLLVRGQEEADSYFWAQIEEQ